MSTNNGDVIRKDEFLHFYCLRKSKDPGYYEFKPWDKASRLPIISPKLEAKFLFLSLEVIGNSSLVRT